MRSLLVVGLAHAGATRGGTGELTINLMQLGVELQMTSNSSSARATSSQQARTSQTSEVALKRAAAFVAATSKDSLVASTQLAQRWCSAVSLLAGAQRRGHGVARDRSSPYATDSLLRQATTRRRSSTAPEDAVVASEAFPCEFDDGDEELSTFSLSNDEVLHARCPPGRYLDQQSPEAEEHRAKRIRKALCEAKRRWPEGALHRNERESTGFTTRGYMTFESSIWPKPEKCKTLPDELWASKHSALAYRYDYPLPSMMKLVNDALGGAEFHLSWKVGSNAFPSYLACEYGQNWTRRRIGTPVKEGAIVASSVREPIGRWISAAGEMLERIINQQCPNGPCGAADSYDPDKTPKVVSHQTTWYNTSISSTGTGTYSKNKFRELMEGLINDTGCNYRTYASEHLNSQVNFVTQNPGRAANLSVIVKLEDLDGGLNHLSQKLRGPYVNASSECKLVPENTKICKPHQDRVPSAHEMRSFLDLNPPLMRNLCLIYAQDFICFDYDLPEACKGMF